jgi:sodium-dependent phosphate cotransporter
VPLGGAGVITTEQAFPVTLGANLGTTVTALLASLATSGSNAQAGVTIALVHVLFNGVGTMLIFPIRAVRRIPVMAAERLAAVAADSRQWAVIYVLILFYLVPAAFAFLDRFI